jgi:hypothetical protein
MSAPPSGIEVLRSPAELTPEWLSAALGGAAVESFELEAIGTGQMSESTRVRLAYRGAAVNGPASVVMKSASTDENSRGTGVGLGIYEREVRFYSELAPRIGGPLARCHLAQIDATALHDPARDRPSEQGDQIAAAAWRRHVAIGAARAAARARLRRPHCATAWLNQGHCSRRHWSRSC